MILTPETEMIYKLALGSFMYTFCELLYIPYTNIYIYIHIYIYIYECMYGSIPTIMAVEKTGVIWLQ